MKVEFPQLLQFPYTLRDNTCDLVIAEVEFRQLLQVPYTLRDNTCDLVIVKVELRQLLQVPYTLRDNTCDLRYSRDIRLGTLDGIAFRTYLFRGGSCTLLGYNMHHCMRMHYVHYVGWVVCV